MMTLAEIAELLHGEVTGNGDAKVERVAKIEEAGPGDITFLANLKYKKYLVTTNATAILISHGAQFDELARRTSAVNLIKVADPYAGFLQLIERFHPAALPLPRGIHPSAVIAESAAIGINVAIG